MTSAKHSTMLTPGFYGNETETYYVATNGTVHVIQSPDLVGVATFRTLSSVPERMRYVGDVVDGDFDAVVEAIEDQEELYKVGPGKRQDFDAAGDCNRFASFEEAARAAESLDATCSLEDEDDTWEVYRANKAGGWERVSA